MRRRACFHFPILHAVAWLFAGVGHGQAPPVESGIQFDEHYLPRISALLSEGEYRVVARVSTEALDRSAAPWKWQVIRLRALEAMGQWDVISSALPDMVEAYPDEAAFLVEAHRLFLALGKRDAAVAVLARGNEAARGKKLGDRSASELVALGRLAAALGAEPDKVLKQFFAAAKAKDPKMAEAFLAAGELALAKSDYARAAEEFRGGLKISPRDPDLRFGLAKAFWSGDREEAIANAERVLEINPNHAGALLLQAEHLVQSEQWDEAAERIQKVVAVNPVQPEAWALRSVMAILRDNDEDLAWQAREQALSSRDRNPGVPHLIGRCLSKRYRFADGAAEQRLALEWEPGFLPARIQLASDLLRLGDEEGAWALAAEVAGADPYNVLAYNYLQLQDQLATYETRRTEHFTLRMEPLEMAIYGDRALALLEEARAVLPGKYGMELTGPTLVEFFAEQQDFAIRTFGELGGAGYLGVCFGTVITANSPASSSSGTSNWEATLWHEFCHVVTLTATRNRMPRWLSEGISVHEERLRDPTWGQPMTPAWRERILRPDGLTPVSELSGAFLGASDPDDLMFAYFQSSLVVDFLAAEHGEEALRLLLGRLAGGEPINQALATATGSLEEFESRFAAFAKARAEAFGPEVDWTRPDELAADGGSVETHPRNYWVRQGHTLRLLDESRWEEAAASAQALIDLFPDQVSGDNGYAMLARARRALGQTREESVALREWTRRTASAPAAYQRLLDLDQEAGNWAGLEETARRQMAVNPLIRSSHDCLACAAEQTGNQSAAIGSLEKLLRLKPENPAEVHFRLGKLLAGDDPERARREVLESLLEAPRFTGAHDLLVELKQKRETP